MKTELAPTVTVSTPASPWYSPSVWAKTAAVWTGLGETVTPLVDWAEANPAAVITAALSKQSAPAARAMSDSLSGDVTFMGNFR